MVASKGSGSRSTGSGTRARSAITGRFVTTATAVRHPRTTVVETPKSPGKKK
jgi:hypothetical protein